MIIRSNVFKNELQEVFGELGENYIGVRIQDDTKGIGTLALYTKDLWTPVDDSPLKQITMKNYKKSKE